MTLRHLSLWHSLHLPCSIDLTDPGDAFGSEQLSAGLDAIEVGWVVGNPDLCTCCQPAMSQDLTNKVLTY